MKKYDLYIFFLGLITGIFLTVIIAICYNNYYNQESSDITFFEKPKDFIPMKEIEVFQVLDDSIALAKCNDFGSGHYGTVFLIKGNENLYDDQKIDLSHFSVQQIGIYRYETRDDLDKAVPFIEIKNNIYRLAALWKQDLEKMNILVVLKKCVPLIIVTLHKKKRRMQSLLIVRNILCYPKNVWQISSCKKDICMEVPY